MTPLPYHRVTVSGLGGLCLTFVMLLCCCVVLQMLGVPATLLDPSAAVDALTASVLEGFSVPPTVPQLSPSFESVPTVDGSPLVHVPVLASAPFHPPLS